MIDHEHSVCVILETHPLCSVSYAPIMDLYDSPSGSLQIKVDPGLDCLVSEFNHTHDTGVTESIAVNIDAHTLGNNNPIGLA